MSTQTKVIKQGENLALSYMTDPLQDMTDWTCRVMVKADLDSVALIDKTLSTLSSNLTARIGQLTPVETAALDPGGYLLLADLDNAITEENSEVHITLIVEKQGVP